jgi:hypothetical protein
MKYAVALACAAITFASALAPGSAQTIDPLACPNCVTAAAAQQSVLQSQISQQQLSATIQRSLDVQQQTQQLQQALNQWQLQAQLSPNGAAMQTLLLQQQMQLMQYQLIRLRADAHRREAKPKHNP